MVRRRRRLSRLRLRVEGVDGGLDGVEDAVVAGGDGDHGLFPGGDLGADGVLLDHGGYRVGDARRACGRRRGWWEAGLVAGGLVQLAEGGEAAEAGDQAVEAVAFGVRGGGRPRSACAGREATIEVISSSQGVGVEGGAVAGERVLGDGVERDGEDRVGHGAGLRVRIRAEDKAGGAVLREAGEGRARAWGEAGVRGRWWRGWRDGGAGACVRVARGCEV